MTTEPKTYRLQSNDMVHTPGIIAWAINGYAFEDDRQKLRDIITQTYGLDEDVVDCLLSGEVAYSVEDDAVVFTIGTPSGTP